MSRLEFIQWCAEQSAEISASISKLVDVFMREF